MAGLIWEQLFDHLCTLLGIDPEPLTRMEDHLLREYGA
jgi:hypothetical protein